MPLNRELILNYAEALYHAAAGQGLQHQVRSELEAILDFAESSPELLRRLSYLFRSAKVASEEKNSILNLMCETFELGELTRKWLSLVAKRGRLGLLPHFIRAYVEEYRIAEGVLAASVRSAFPLSEEQKAAIRSSLEKTLNASVDLEPAVDPELIAGVRVEAVGKVWDMSIKGMLERTAARQA